MDGILKKDGTMDRRKESAMERTIRKADEERMGKKKYKEFEQKGMVE